MPQMSPTWWLTLFIMFIITLAMINPLNYFSKNYHLKTPLKESFMALPHLWKW